ncbi:TPA: hypothetical protein ACGO6G_000859 [Streptococcus suis]
MGKPAPSLARGKPVQLSDFGYLMWTYHLAKNEMRKFAQDQS